MSSNQTIITIIILVACSAAMFFLGRETKPAEVMMSFKTDTLYICDTVLRTAEPVLVEKAKANIRNRESGIGNQGKETLPNSQFPIPNSFVATLDTIINADTLHAEFEYPEALFSILLKRRPDSTFIKTIFIDRTIYAQKERASWEIPVYVGVGVIGGFLLGRIVK